MRQFGELPELYVDGFDAEGIWEQIKLRVLVLWWNLMIRKSRWSVRIEVW